MKTIIFSTDKSVIEQYQKQGEVIIAKDPIKTLKAMKKLGNKDEYRVIGEDKYIEVAQKLGYNRVKTEVVPVQTVGKLTSFYEEQLKRQEKDFNDKLEKLKNETDGLKEMYGEKLGELEQKKIELEQKKTELEQERVKIKKAIKNAINESD